VNSRTARPVEKRAGPPDASARFPVQSQRQALEKDARQVEVSAGWGAHTAGKVSAGNRRYPLRKLATTRRQALLGDGRAALAATKSTKTHFLGNPIISPAPRDSPSRLHLMRDPVNRPLARPQRERAGPLALRDFARSRIRCSWRLGLVRFRQASPPADDGDEHEGPSKNFTWPPAALPSPSPPSASPAAGIALNEG
jgi:hypothetical protein